MLNRKSMSSIQHRLSIQHFSAQEITSLAYTLITHTTVEHVKNIITHESVNYYFLEDRINIIQSVAMDGNRLPGALDPQVVVPRIESTSFSYNAHCM